MNGRAVAIALAIALVAALASCSKRSAHVEESAPNIFKNACARCHGADGTGGLQPEPWMTKTPNFHDPAFQASHTDEQIRHSILYGKGEWMPPWRAVFSEKEVAGLVQYVRAFGAEKPAAH